MALAAGAACFLYALWDLSDASFGSAKSGSRPFGDLVYFLPAWLYAAFGHWGPRILVMALGAILVIGSFWLSSVVQADEAEERQAGRTRSDVVAWTLLALVFAVLAFLVVGPSLRIPAVDRALAYWQESHYPAIVTFAALVFGLGVQSWWRWLDFRESGDPWDLLRPAIYVVSALAVVLFFSWRAICGAMGC